MGLTYGTGLVQGTWSSRYIIRGLCPRNTIIIYSMNTNNLRRTVDTNTLVELKLDGAVHMILAVQAAMLILA